MHKDMLDAYASTCWPFTASRLDASADNTTTDIELEWAARPVPAGRWRGMPVVVMILSLCLLLPASLILFSG